MSRITGRTARIFFLLAAAVAVYANCLDNGFVYDDNKQILANPWLHDFRHVPDIFASHVWGFENAGMTNYYRPLMHLAYLLVYQGFGPNPFWFHLASLAVHLLNCLLVWKVAVELCPPTEGAGCERSADIPFLAALCFAVHPINTETVAWAASMHELLYTMFSLVSLLFFLRAGFPDRGERPFSVLSVLAFCAALLSKETSAVLPALFLVHDFLFRRASFGERKRTLFLRYLPYAAAFAAYLAIRMAVLGTLLRFREGASLSAGETAAAFSEMVLWYLGKLVWPFAHNFYPWLEKISLLPEWESAGMVLLLAAILAASWRLCRNRPLPAFAVSLVLLPLLPLLPGITVGLQAPVAERYLYLPSVGFCIILAWCFSRIPAGGTRWPGWRAAAVAVLLLAYSVSTASRNPDFADDLTIWSDTVRRSPDAPQPRAWLATKLFERNRYGEGIEQARKSIALGGEDQANLFNLGLALEKRGDPARAADCFRKLLAANPADPLAHYRLGEALLDSGHPDEAEAELAEAVREDASFAEGHFLLGIALGKLGRIDESMTEIRKAIELKPNFPEAGEALERLKGAGRK